MVGRWLLCLAALVVVYVLRISTKDVESTQNHNNLSADRFVDPAGDDDDFREKISQRASGRA